MANNTHKEDDCDPMERPFAECVGKGMNPNPNAPGEISLMSKEEITKWAGSIFNRLRAN